ncbi:MAG: beta-Ala-His dipeptidase [Candidatus Thorarchaeota archaeon]
MVFEKLEPRIVWSIFENVFTKTPRESKKEEKIRAVLKKWIAEVSSSRSLNIEIKEDDSGNMLLRKPATPGFEKLPSVLLQGHLDMVCETGRKGGFDFTNKAIPVRIQENGEWVDADGTTLGADNGMGMSLALALMVDPEVKHGPLEILATVDEETGLTGAFALQPKEIGIMSKLLINIDSEDLGIITIGSAGGGDTIFTKKIPKAKTAKNFAFRKISVTGLLGGHSGVDIHLHRGNANKILARILATLIDEVPIVICEWNGGGKRNAIPRDSTTVFGYPMKRSSNVEEILKKAREEILAYYKADKAPLEPNLKIDWNETDSCDTFSPEESKKIIHTFHILPHGPLRFSPAIEDLVETSNNVAVINTDDEGIHLQMSTRSNLDSELAAKRRELAFIGEDMGWNVEQTRSYPGWAPDPTNTFLNFIREKYEEVLGSDIVVKAIHAGLECGILGAGIPGLKMVSIGPTIKNPHSPDEKLKIEDVGILYSFLKNVLRNLPKA